MISVGYYSTIVALITYGAALQIDSVNKRIMNVHNHNPKLY